MKFDLTKPCANCPFRSDIKPYLRRGGAASIATDITQNQRTFTCHKTTVTDPDDDSAMMDGPNAQHCAGALILLEKLKQPNQMMRWMERINMYDRTKLDMNAPVFDTVKEFVRAQER
jgi:hypothetical protein